MKTSRYHAASALFRHALGGLLLVAALALPVRAVDPDLPFESGSSGALGPLKFLKIIPGGRAYVAMAYFPPTQKTILFGGHIGADRAETWEFDGTNWVQLFPATVPPPRREHRMVFDAERNEIVMFGGYRDSVGYLGDTWVWKDGNWTQKNPETSPSPRSRTMMAFDGGAGRRNVILVGGDNSPNMDTWAWDGTTWSNTSSTAPFPNYAGSGAAYDAAREEVVLFLNNAETWVWKGTGWNRKEPTDRPSGRSNHRLAYDPLRQAVLLFGGDSRPDTWTWDGTNWTSKATSPVPSRGTFGMDWDAARQKVVVYGGYATENPSAETWFWNGTDWTYHSGATQWFDMTESTTGRYDYTTIEIPSGVTIRFIRNAANTPVRWLATGDVVINGVIDVSGEAGLNSFAPGEVAQGGPGGFNGGARGVRFDVSTSYAGGPGQGPGGGLPGTQPVTNPQNLRDGQPGRHARAYGNAFLQPLQGGSGGGGGSSVDTGDGASGGAGGGAIMISTSRDIILNGLVRANGGDVQGHNSVGGRGSGGAILLKADRVSGPGGMEAYGGASWNTEGEGRIRVEAFVRTITMNAAPPFVGGLPGANGDVNNVGATLQITSVKGVGVPALPSGNLTTPDVVFTETGPVTVVVNGTGIPDGTPVVLRVTTSNGVVTGNANMAGGTASIQVTIPRGLGTLQATAQFPAP